MAKEYLKKLQEQIESLEDGFDIKSIELGLLQNEMQDTLRPNIILSQLTHFILQMLGELNEYQQKNKLSAKAIASKTRLITMINITIELSGMGDKMQTLKLFNLELVNKMQLLRVENANLRKELKGVEDAHNYKTT
jgi:hypothetical protein